MFLQLAHTKTDVFRSSKMLLLESYKITRRFPSDEKFNMVQQIRRAAASVHLNVAEGCSRKSEGERKRYFEVSRGSVIEIDTAIGVACDLGYQQMEELESFGNLIISCFKQLTALIGKQK